MAASSSVHGEEMEEMEEMLLFAAFRGNLPLLKNVAMRLNKGKGTVEEAVKAIQCPDGLSALHYAAAGGSTDICRYLIEELGIPVDFPSKGGETPLLRAAKEGRYVTVKYLIDKGADPTATDKECSTPLLNAASYGHAEVVKLLLSRGVPVDPKHHYGTPLYRAAQGGYECVMEILLQHGADSNYLLYGFMTPMFMCMRTGSLKCIKLLIEAGADPNLKCPLGFAVHQNQMDIMKCLLDNGADPNIPAEDGKYPIEVAAKLNRKEMVHILFPLTSPIPHIKCWSLEALYEHVSSDAFQERSICWLQAGFGEHALKDAYSARSLRPDWPKAHYRVGAALMLLKEYEQASQSFEEGLKFDPTNEDIRKALQNALDCKRKSEQ